MGSIDSGAGIRPSPASGIPTYMTGAALRRAWSTDPAIRDFIGLSENSWDFDAAGSVPGLGSVTRDDARRLLARVVGETKTVDAEQPAAEQLIHGQVLTRTGEAVQAPSSFARVK